MSGGRRYSGTRSVMLSKSLSMYLLRPRLPTAEALSCQRCCGAGMASSPNQFLYSRELGAEIIADKTCGTFNYSCKLLETHRLIFNDPCHFFIVPPEQRKDNLASPGCKREQMGCLTKGS